MSMLITLIIGICLGYGAGVVTVMGVENARYSEMDDAELWELAAEEEALEPPRCVMGEPVKTELRQSVKEWEEEWIQ